MLPTAPTFARHGLLRLGLLAVAATGCLAVPPGVPLAAPELDAQQDGLLDAAADPGPTNGDTEAGSDAAADFTDPETRAADLDGALPDAAGDGDAAVDAATADLEAEATTADAAESDVAPDAPDVQPDADASPDPTPPLAAALTVPLWLDQGAFPPVPGHPSAVVHAPAGLQPDAPLHVVVYLHGHWNCAQNVLGDTDTACTPGGPKRPASHLAKQLAASGRQALLLVPELAFDQASSAAGKLGQPLGLQQLLAEALAKLPAPLGPKTLGDVAAVRLASHSGGYLAAAGIATKGGVPVTELWLLDSVYGAVAGFEAWLQQDLASFGGGPTGVPWQRRFAVVYTDGGGTAKLSQQLAAKTQPWVPAGAWLHDTTTATWPPATYDRGLLFKRSGLSHHGVTKYYFQQLLATSGVPEG